ncbi:MAG: protein-disulfide reductase DsbD N-terminal domain-containing protein [Gammaproteobacteria bacterium]|nr:protein-disulfide reductase DsbD N-terminal domain-containing protein [Gammaproteobacteria bacterium]
MPRQGVLNALKRSVCVAGIVAAGHPAAQPEQIEFDIKDPLAEPSAFLPVGQAFVFSSRRRVAEGDVDELVARWQMPPGYYLYRHGFQAHAGEGLTIGQPAIPRGEWRTDAFFGESEVYLGNVEIVVPVVKRTAQTVTVRFGYQGCAEQGLCYPPAERTATFHFAETPARLRGFSGPLLAGVVLFVVVGGLVLAMRSRRDVR